MPITVKLLEMIKNIENGEDKSLIETANFLEISERNLRYKIEDFNYYLEILDLPIITIKKRELEIPVKLSDIISKLNTSKNVYSYTKEEREKIILCDIFFKNPHSTLKQLEEKFDVTDVTIKTDIKSLENYLRTFVISLNNKTLDYKAEERNTRKIILDILLKNYTVSFPSTSEEKLELKKNYQYGFFVPWKEMDAYFDDEIIRDAITILKEIISSVLTNVDDEKFKVLLVYIIISLKRKEEYPITKIQNIEFLKKSEEYQSIEKILSKYNFNTLEIINMVEYFLGSNSFDLDESFYGTWVQIEIAMMQLISEISKNGYEELDRDLFLLENLINHIKPAIYRMKKGINLPYEIYDEFKESYPLILKLVENNWTKLGLDSLNVDKNELAYIAMHFQLAIKRIESKKLENILIVCGAGYSTSRFLYTSIREYFNVNIVDVIPYNQLENYNTDKENIDLIVTIVDGIQKEGIKTVKVSPILTNEDIITLNNLKLEHNKKIKLSELVNTVKQYSKELDEESFINNILKQHKTNIINDLEKKDGIKLIDMMPISHIDNKEKIETWEEAIKLSSNLLEKDGIVTKDYENKIIEAVHKFGNYMIIQDGIFLGHSDSYDCINKSGISLLYLKKAVEFPGDEKVNIVLTLASKDKKEHLNGLMEFLELIRENNLIELFKNRNNKYIYNYILEFIENKGRKL